MDKMFLESRIYNGDIVAIQDFSRAITRGTIEHLIDVSTKVEKAEVTAWLMRYKEANFPDMSAELKL
jgi:predicted thioredoxin/glutaredoxin